MAYAWAQELLGDKYEYFIVANWPSEAGPGTPLYLVLEENGLQIPMDLCTFDSLTVDKFDIVFELSSLADESLPELRGEKNIHVGLDSPDYLARDLELEDQLKVFRRINDEIKQFVLHIDHYLAR